MFPFGWLPPPPPPATPEQVGFKNFEVGDCVCTKSGSRKGSGKIIAIVGADYSVEFTDGEVAHFLKGDLARERPCPLAGCAKMNEEGVTTCWNCGNRLPLVPA